MEKVKKDILTKEIIIDDLLEAEKYRGPDKTSGFLALMIALIIISIILGNIINIYVGIVISLLAVYPLIQFIKQIRISKMRRELIMNGGYTISIDNLVNVDEETFYEIHNTMFGGRTTRTADFLYFSSQKWMIPGVNYLWSEYKMSREGIKNTSIIGDEFYLVSVNNDYEIACVYNTKFFETRDK